MNLRLEPNHNICYTAQRVKSEPTPMLLSAFLRIGEAGMFLVQLQSGLAGLFFSSTRKNRRMTTTFTSPETQHQTHQPPPFEGNVLFLGAHPDDEAMTYAEAIARLTTQDRERVFVLTASLGEESTLGDQETVQSGGRLNEVEKVYNALGVLPWKQGRRFYPKLPDTELHLPGNIRRLANIIIDVVRSHNISSIVTPGPDGFDGHSDHAAMHEAAMLAASMLAEESPVTVWGADVSGEGDCSLGVNEAHKRKLILMHRSQYSDEKALDAIINTEPYNTLTKEEKYKLYKVSKSYQPKPLQPHIP